MTSKTADIRLRENNSGSNKWTRSNGPFKLLHTEQFTTRDEAAAREKFLKSGADRRILDQLMGE
jgi:predicted GIY-YIG superfamily endonuclease